MKMFIHSFLCKNFILSSFCLLLLPMVASRCDCQAETERNLNLVSDEALKLKLIAIASILLASAVGVCLPFLVKNISLLQPDKEAFSLIKSFAAGVILATAFIHILPDAYESLKSPCLSRNPWHRFPFASFVAMMAAILTLMMESFATGYHKRSELSKAQPVNGDEESDDQHGVHGHGSANFALELDGMNSSDLIRHRVISQVLELGIIVHSVIIGISLGASGNPRTIKPLVAALSFHQFFEGMGLGGCIIQARFKHWGMIIMVLFFSLTTPIGITLGLGISNAYKENNPTSLIIEGLLNSASAGILIYMSLVDLIAHDFMSTKMLSNFKLQLGTTFALVLGVCCMSLIARWGDH